MNYFPKNLNLDIKKDYKKKEIAKNLFRNN